MDDIDRKPFIMLLRHSRDFELLIKKRPTAFVLLTLIAMRARRTDDFDDELEVGEALVGDHKTYGVTEQAYRTDKIYLEKLRFATFRATTKGTIARIASTSIFDINAQSPTNTSTGYQRTTNGQLTTNKNDKNEKNAADEIRQLIPNKTRVEDGTLYVRSGKSWDPIHNPEAYLTSLQAPVPALSAQDREAAWKIHAPTVLHELNLTDPYVVQAAYEAFVSKSRSTNANAVRKFIETQMSLTPPAEYADKLFANWPTEKEVAQSA